MSSYKVTVDGATVDVSLFGLMIDERWPTTFRGTMKYAIPLGSKALLDREAFERDVAGALRASIAERHNVDVEMIEVSTKLPRGGRLKSSNPEK